MALDIYSWTLAGLGILGLWITGKDYRGWLIGALCQTLWIIYMCILDQPALVVQGAVFMLVFVRNYFVGRRASLTLVTEQDIV